MPQTKGNRDDPRTHTKNTKRFFVLVRVVSWIVFFLLKNQNLHFCFTDQEENLTERRPRNCFECLENLRHLRNLRINT